MWHGHGAINKQAGRREAATSRTGVEQLEDVDGTAGRLHRAPGAAARAGRLDGGLHAGRCRHAPAVLARSSFMVTLSPVRTSVARQKAQPSVARNVSGMLEPRRVTFTASPAADSDR